VPDRAVPVLEIARALDIDEVRQVPLDGAEGVLLTDRVRSRGRILVNSTRGRRSARFGIAHELGHFLLERHELLPTQTMFCRRTDMRETRSDGRHRRQETEANRFAIGLLAPASLTAPILAGQPEIGLALALKDRLDISLEAAARCLVDRHDEPLAAVWTRNGTIRYVVRGHGFPFIIRGKGETASPASLTGKRFADRRYHNTAMHQVSPLAWTTGNIPELFEQVRIGDDGHSLTLLWATPAEQQDD
jgi:hypothetical protein